MSNLLRNAEPGTPVLLILLASWIAFGAGCQPKSADITPFCLKIVHCPECFAQGRGSRYAPSIKTDSCFRIRYGRSRNAFRFRPAEDGLILDEEHEDPPFDRVRRLNGQNS